MKQSLVTEKNRKIRHMREIYPDVNVKLLYRRDFHRLLAKFGFGPMAQADVRGISLPIGLDFMFITHYAGGNPSGVTIAKDLDLSLDNEDVILVEDIVDTGMTLNYLIKHLESKEPASVEVCTLLDKRARRLVDVPLSYVGFEVPDEFLVGYGLDYLEKYRNLPFIAVLKPDSKG